jgi:hypothetical protein
MAKCSRHFNEAAFILEVISNREGQERREALKKQSRQNIY